MKITNLITTAIIILPTFQFTVNAATTCTKLSSCNGVDGADIGSLEGCIAGQTDECYSGSYVGTSSHFYSCTQCNSYRTLKTVYAEGCDEYITPTECVCNNNCRDIAWTTTGMTTGYEYSIQCGATCDNSRKYRCAADYYGTTTNGTSGCQPKANCVSDTKYQSFGSTGYERRIIRTYNSTNRTCDQTSVLYRCAAGYYGSSTNGTSGCTRCPGSKAGGLGDGEDYGSSDAGTTSITGCFIPSDVEICDDTGCFEMTDDCHWTY